MSNLKQVLVKSGVLVLALCSTLINAAGVDPAWLKSWNEALEQQPKQFSSQSKVVAEDEPGTALLIRGQIFNPDGKTVAPDVLVHIYHRNAAGFEFGKNDRALSTWELQAWAKTDAQGRFEFQTIKPAADYLGREGPHIHITTVSEKFGTQWAPKVYFMDDQTLSDRQKEKSQLAGPFAWVKDTKSVEGVLTMDIQIKLKTKTDF